MVRGVVDHLFLNFPYRKGKDLDLMIPRFSVNEQCMSMEV